MVGWALTWTVHELQGILRCETQGLDAKNKNVLVHLVYIARSMCHSLLQHILIPSLAIPLHKTRVHTYVRL